MKRLKIRRNSQSDIVNIVRQAYPSDVSDLELMQKRRLVVGYEKLPETSESFIYIAMVHLMSKRLSQNQ